MTPAPLVGSAPLTKTPTMTHLDHLLQLRLRVAAVVRGVQRARQHAARHALQGPHAQEVREPSRLRVQHHVKSSSSRARPGGWAHVHTNACQGPTQSLLHGHAPRPGLTAATTAAAAPNSRQWPPQRAHLQALQHAVHRHVGVRGHEHAQAAARAARQHVGPHLGQQHDERGQQRGLAAAKLRGAGAGRGGRWGWQHEVRP